MNLITRCWIANAVNSLVAVKDKACLAAYNLAITGYRNLFYYAAGDDDASSVTDAVTEKVENIKNMILTLVGLAGTIYLVLSIVKAAKGHKNGDDRQFDQGISGVIVSIILIMIDTVVGIFA